MSIEIRLNRMKQGASVETVALNDRTSCIVLEYPLRTAPADTEQLTESVIILLIGTLENMQNKLKTIETLFLRARERAEQRAGDRIYIEKKVSDVDGWWRSELVDGLVTPSNKTLDQTMLGKMEFTLSWTRTNAWEGAEVQIPLTNGNGINNISGLTVYPFDDGQAGRDNWVDIAGSSVAGDLPAKVRMELTNTYDSSNRTGDIILALNWKSSPTTFAQVIEGESYTNSLGGTPSIVPSTPDFDSYSNGQYVSQTINDTQTGLAWTLSGDFLRKCAGNVFKIVGLFINLPTDCWAQISVTLGGLTKIYEGPWIKINPYQTSLTHYFVEIDTLQLPPYLIDMTGTLGELSFEIRFKRPSGSSNVLLDFLALLATDGYRKIKHLGYDLGYGAKLVDDEINGLIYAVWSDGIWGYQVAYGELILLEPGVDQRLYILTTGAYPAQRTSSVKLFYRARKLTL